MSEFLRVERAGPVATLWIDRQPKMNTLTVAMRNEFPGIFDALDKADSVRVIIIRGAGGKAFSAGGDVAEFLTLAPADGEPREAARDGGRARVEGRVREAPVAVHDGLGVGTAQRRAIEEPGERHETRRTFPLFFRSSTYWTAARAFESGKLRSITGFSVPCAT